MNNRNALCRNESIAREAYHLTPSFVGCRHYALRVKRYQLFSMVLPNRLLARLSSKHIVKPLDGYILDFKDLVLEIR